VSINKRVIQNQVDDLERLLNAADRLVDEEPDDYVRMRKRQKVEELRERVENKRAELKGESHAG
jgi:hypothetical protein